MFAAPASWRVVKRRIGIPRSRRGRRGSSRPGRRTRCRRRGRAAGRRGSAPPCGSKRHGVLAVHGRPLELRPVLVRGIDVPDRPLARPLGREQQHAHEGGFLRVGCGREDWLGPALEPWLARAVRRASRRSDSIVERAEEQVADPRAGVRVPVGDRRRAGSRSGRGASSQPAAGSSRRRRRAARRPAPRRAAPTRAPCPSSSWRRSSRRHARAVDDARSPPPVSTPLLRSRRATSAQWKYCPPSITIVCPVMKSAAGAAEEDDRADDVLGHLVALDRPRRDRDVAQLLDDLRVRLHAGAHREPGRDAVHADVVLAELLRERAGEGDDRALARHVVEEERDAAERRPRGDVHDLAAAAARASPGRPPGR